MRQQVINTCFFRYTYGVSGNLRLNYQIEKDRVRQETKIGDGVRLNKRRTARFVRCGKYFFRS